MDYSHGDVLHLVSIGGEEGVQTLCHVDVVKLGAIAVDVWALVLLLLDFSAAHRFVRQRAGKRLYWDVFVYSGSVNLHSPSRGTGQVADVAPVWPVKVVDALGDLVLLDQVRVHVAAGLPRVVGGVVTGPPDQEHPLGHSALVVHDVIHDKFSLPFAGARVDVYAALIMSCHEHT